jgi:hypothetical protein
MFDDDPKSVEQAVDAVGALIKDAQGSVRDNFLGILWQSIDTPHFSIRYAAVKHLCDALGADVDNFKERLAMWEEMSATVARRSPE